MGNKTDGLIKKLRKFESREAKGATQQNCKNDRVEISFQLSECFHIDIHKFALHVFGYEVNANDQ